MSAPQTKNAPDVRQLANGDLAEGPFPGGRNQPFRIFFEPAVHGEVWKHATENMAVEICGVVVGKWGRDVAGPYVLISEAIRGEAATNKFAEVTFTHDTWAKINEQMDSRFAHLSIVGWYHSHPDFGVFLSDRDRFIQENFFSGAGQVACVVDPVRRTEGVFIWREGKPVLAPHFWVGDRIQVTTAAGQEQAAPARSEPGNANAITPQPSVGSSGRAIDWLAILTHVGVCLLVFLLGYLVAGKLTDVNIERIRQEASANALGRWAVLKIRPGLRQELNQTTDLLEMAARNTHRLAQENLKLVEDKDKRKETATQWEEGVLRPLVGTLKKLAAIKTTYGLTQQEMEILEKLGYERLKPKKGEKSKPKKSLKKDKK